MDARGSLLSTKEVQESNEAIVKVLSKPPMLNIIFLAETHCPVLGTPISGRKLGNGYNRGDIVKFQCKPGFVLKGSAIRKCMENGVWNGTEAICKGIETMLANAPSACFSVMD